MNNLKHGRQNRIIKISLIALVATLQQACAPAQTQDSANYDNKPEVSANVIYGSDGRLDLYQVSDDRLKLLADSTVALISNSDLSVNGNSVLIKGSSFASDYQLCSSERFREQNTSAFCSGSLVGEDTIITAGHCITNASDCSSTSFVFGYAVKSAGVLPSSVASSEVYKCKSIIKQVLTNGAADFAVIKLDRKVPNHAVLAVRPSGEAAVGDPLVVIGHPAGLPTKVTAGGKVRSIAAATHFVADVDTYGGNSGSAVFNPNTGYIEGILVRGEEDFVRQSSGCYISNVCAEGSCRGEDITRISLVRSYIPSSSSGPDVPPVVIDPVSNKYSSSPKLAIPDNNSTGIKNLIAVDSLPGSRKVFISLDISHTYIGDLVIKVTSPSGKVAILHSRAGGSSDDIKKVYEATSILGSESKKGNYQIAVQDLAKIDKGILNSWSIEFK